jgi:serine/threonine-protein kinase
VAAPSRFGEYTLETELGRGATGLVYRARAADGKLVAVKLLADALAHDDVFRARLAREARLGRELRDPHLVRILDTGAEDDQLFVVVEYMAGGSLAAKLADGALALDEAVRVVSEVDAGLDALHGAGIVHRDVKPSNVMLRSDNSAALTDFGLAKAAAQTVLTRPGQVLGTLDYLAPEVIRGGEATAASDVYALGCVAFECVAGTPPFADRSLFGVGSAHLEDAPPDPPTSPAFAWALLRALAKDPSERPATAMTYAHLLRAAKPS